MFVEVSDAGDAAHVAAVGVEQQGPLLVAYRPLSAAFDAIAPQERELQAQRGHADMHLHRHRIILITNIIEAQLKGVRTAYQK